MSSSLGYLADKTKIGLKYFKGDETQARAPVG